MPIAQKDKPYNPPADYRRLAGTYSFWEYLVFANQLQRCRLSFLSELEQSKNLLLLGDGDGRFSTQLLRTLPGIQISSLDASAPLLQAAKKRRKKNGILENGIRAINEDVLNWKGDGQKYDSVVAQFFFDSFEGNELETIADQLQNVLNPGGKLLVSEFNIPRDTRIGNLRARITLTVLYTVFGVLTDLKTKRLTDHTPILCGEGFILKKTKFFSQKILAAQVFELPGKRNKNIPNPIC